MDTKIKFTKNDLEKIITRAENISDPSQRLKYLKDIKLKYLEIFKPKGRVKLLSKTSELILEDFKNRFNRLFDEALKRLKVATEFPNTTPRKIEDYIIWIGKTPELQSLIKELIEEECIKEKDVEKIIDEHFYIEDYSEVKDEKYNRITWLKFLPDLVHLFDRLSSNNFLENFILKKHKNLAPHFKDRFTNDISDDKLRKEFSKYKKKKDYKTDRFWDIDQILEKTLGINSYSNKVKK